MPEHEDQDSGFGEESRAAARDDHRDSEIGR
jgi:hypothetical protein